MLAIHSHEPGIRELRSNRRYLFALRIVLAHPSSGLTLFDTSRPVMMGSLCACVCRNMLIDMPDERSIMLPESLADIAVLIDSTYDEQYLCMLKAHWLSEP